MEKQEVLLFNRSEEKRAANRAEGYAVTGDFTEGTVSGADSVTVADGLTIVGQGSLLPDGAVGDADLQLLPVGQGLQWSISAS